MSTTRKVTIRKNSAAPEFGAQERINFIEGLNVTITVGEDAADKEVDVTIAAVALPPVWVDQFYPAVAPDNSKGTYATLSLDDEVDTDVYHTFMIPGDVVTVDTAVVIVIPDASGDLRWECATNFAQVCADEGYQTHTDSVAATITAVIADEVECIDISDALTGAEGGDLVGIMWRRTASNAADTINDMVHYVGILIQGSA